jgi:hypothetical protein
LSIEGEKKFLAIYGLRRVKFTGLNFEKEIGFVDDCSLSKKGGDGG